MTRTVCPPMLLALLVCLPAQAQEKANIAVLELTAEGVEASAVRVLSDRLRTELFKTGAFTVAERGQMEEILKEQGFQQSGCASDQCAVEVGQMLGVRQMVAGSVGKVGSVITLNIRLIDVATGSITRTVNEDCTCDMEQVLTASTVVAARMLAGQDDAAARRGLQAAAPRQRTHRLWPKVVLGSLAVLTGGAGVLFNQLAQAHLDDAEAVAAAYEQSHDNLRYPKFAADYRAAYDDAHADVVTRNVSYIAAGVFAVGFGVSFAF